MDGAPLGERLRRFRRAAGLTIEELAAASGVSERTIGNMERGASRRPQRGTVGLIADALGLTAPERDALLAGRPAPSAAPAVSGRTGAVRGPPPPPRRAAATAAPALDDRLLAPLLLLHLATDRRSIVAAA